MHLFCKALAHQHYVRKYYMMSQLQP